MNITILCVGRLKEKYLISGVAEYMKRLNAFGTMKIIEVNDEKCPDHGSEKEKKQVIEREGKKIMASLPKGAYPITLEIGGKQLSSEDLAAEFNRLPHQGISHIVFIIGGSLGLCPSIKKLSRLSLSFSQMTFPHQLMRLILVEQIYRAFTINMGTAYHK